MQTPMPISRRRFLQSGLIGCAGTAIARSAPAQNDRARAQISASPCAIIGVTLESAGSLGSSPACSRLPTPWRWPTAIPT